MTSQQLDELIYNAENGNVEALISACERLLDNYVDLRIRNLILSSHIQLLKLNWILLQDKAQEVLVDDPSIRDQFIKVKSAPTIAKIKELLEYIVKTSQNQSTLSGKEYLHILSTVFFRFSELVPAILNKHLNEYADRSDVKHLVKKYNSSPSFHAYKLFIKAILSLSHKITEEVRGREYYSRILSRWEEVESSPNSDLLIQRCDKLAIILNIREELLFTQTKYRASNGNPADIVSLGILYEQGMGVAKDDNMAKTLYMQALNTGYITAHAYLTNLTQRIQNVVAQQTEQLRIQSQLEIERRAQELRQQEIEDLADRESKRMEEEKRHNEQMEYIERQKLEIANEQQRHINDKETEKEEDIIEVIFYYKLHTWGGDILSGCNMIREIPRETYNGLVRGGKQAIVSYVTGEKGFMRDGEYIMDASMSKL